MSAMTDLMIENRDQRLTELQREMHALRMENDRLRTELERAVNWMDGCAVREKAVSFRKGYAVRLTAARNALAA